ncbi:MAG: hypothetical protein Q8O15_08320 [Rectinemataceae bacterium]|nr:hypothetical protein [Rectinemataceae bacterium]
MDLWYIANKVRGTLPAGFDGMNTVAIAKELGFACHAVRADYTLARPKDNLVLRGFAVDNHQDYPYRLELKNIPFTFEYDEENLRTRVNTPAGEVFTHIHQSADMGRQGISVPFIKAYPLSYPLRSPDDLEAVAQVYEHIDVIPAPENYAAFKERIGDQGLAVAHGLNIASPMHLLLHDLVSMNEFFLFYMDEPDMLHDFAERISPFFEKILDAVLTCDCEVFFWGGNYDQNTTYPDFFAREIKPWLWHAGQKAEACGKLLLTHTDGENRLLLPLYGDSGFHVAESVCTSPMTELTLKEFRDGIGKTQTVWGGIPAVTLMEDAMTDREFEAWLDRMFGDLGDARGLILGVSDNVPPDASLVRLEKIGKRIEDFGAVGPA